MSDNEQSGPFGGLSASEAGKRSWEARRQRAAEAEAAESNGVGIVVTDAETDEIIRALRDKAKRGDVPAARELREWVDIRRESEGRKRDDSFLAVLTPAQRVCISSVLREEPVSPDDALAAWCST